MDTNTKKLHPLLTIAAISVTLFSAVGVAAITGVIPHSKGSAEPAVVAAAPEAAPAPMPEATPAPQPEKKKPVARKHAPAKVAVAETPAWTPPPPPVAQAPTVVEAPKPVVKPGRFGTVAAVREVEVKGDANGVGAVGGGVAGAACEVDVRASRLFALPLLAGEADEIAADAPRTVMAHRMRGVVMAGD